MSKNVQNVQKCPKYLPYLKLSYIINQKGKGKILTLFFLPFLNI